MTNEVSDWFKRYSESSDPDLVVTEMAQEIKRLRKLLDGRTFVTGADEPSAPQPNAEAMRALLQELLDDPVNHSLDEGNTNIRQRIELVLKGDHPNKVKCVICGIEWGLHSAEEQDACSAAL